MSDLTRERVEEWLRLAERLSGAPGSYEKLAAVCRAMLEARAEAAKWKELWVAAKDGEARLAGYRDEAMAARPIIDEGMPDWREYDEPDNRAYAAARAANEGRET